jgi:tetratricopeptide (TPR) repeat protein
MARFWWLRGHYTEGRAHLETLLARPDAPSNPAAWAAAMAGLGALLHKRGDFARAVQTHEAAVAAFRRLGDARGLGRALWALGFTLLSEASERAGPIFEESLKTARAAGDHWIAGASVWGLARVARSEGDLQRASGLLEETLAAARALGNPLALATTLLALAEVAQERGDVEREAGLLGQALPLFRALGEQWGSTACLEGLAAVAAARRRPEQAARLFGAAAAQRDAAGMPLPPVSAALYERALATARAMLDDRGFAAAWREGRGLTSEQAIALALSESTGAEFAA